VRDVQGIIDVGIPVFSRGLTPNSPFKHGPGTIGLPVTLGGS
jgi:4-hydroxy-4-methyl-2-oxoglutarate aldolase